MNILPEQQERNFPRIIQYIMNEKHNKPQTTPLETLQVLTYGTTKANEAHGLLTRYMVLIFVLPGTRDFIIIAITNNQCFL
jgi:hypothetical protein